MAKSSKSKTAGQPASLMDARFDVRSSARLFGTDMDDPGMLHWWGSVSILDLPPFAEWDEGDETPLCEIEGIGLRVEALNDSDSEITILQARGRVLDLRVLVDPYETLDADSQELEGFACLLGSGSNGLHPELDEMLVEPYLSKIVIIERVRIAPAWRGTGGVGRYLMARMLPWICSNPAVVALQPFPVDVQRTEGGEADKAELRRGLKVVERTWRSIGFQPYQGKVWIMDPGGSKHEKAVKRLGKKLGLN